MYSLKPICTLLLAAALQALSAGLVLAQAPTLEEEEEAEFRRAGFFLSLNLGGGVAEGRFGIAEHPEIDQEREIGIGLDLRLGWAISERFQVGVGGASWLKSYSLVDGDTGEDVAADVSYSIGGVFVQAFVYKGFFVHALGGAGFTNVNPRGGVDLDESGLGYAVGLGWESRLTETLALVPRVEYGRLQVDNVDVESGDGGLVPVDPSATFATASLGLAWYF